MQSTPHLWQEPLNNRIGVETDKEIQDSAYSLNCTSQALVCYSMKFITAASWSLPPLPRVTALSISKGLKQWSMPS